MNQSKDMRLQEFVRYAYGRAPVVKALFDGAGLGPSDIQTVDDLDKVPVTTKDRLIELQQADPPFGGFLAVSPDRLQRLCLTPGPIYVPWGGEPNVSESYRQAHTIAGFEAGDVVMLTVAYHFNPVALAVDKELRDAGVTVIASGVGNAELQVRMMRDLGVTGYHGIPSWLMALIEKAEEMGLDFRKEFRLQKAHVAGEPLPPPMRQRFVDEYGLRVTNVYAVAETGVLAYNTEGGYEMRLIEGPIIQVANPETGQSVGPGEVGEVVVTTFNETFPVLRLGLGDMAMNLDPAPGESKQSERSIILVGRTGDAVKVRGIFVHPNQVHFAAGQLAEVARVQGVVTRPENRDELTLRVVPVDDKVDREELALTLGAAIGSLCRIKVDRFEFLPANALEEGAKLLLDERTW